MEKVRILLIDDEVNLCRMMKLNLEREGVYDVTTVFSGEEGLEKVRTESFDLVITDFTMPGMSGGEVIEALKAFKPELPVILSSVFYDDPKTISRATNRKADGLIGKPIDHLQLKQVIADVLARHRKKSSPEGTREQKL